MAAPSGLSARETDVLHALAQVGTITCSDWDKVAELANMKTGKYARDTWAAASKKLKAGTTTAGAKAGDAADPGSAGKSASRAKTKTTPRKRKDADDDDDAETPPKKSKATPNSKGSKTEGKNDSPVKSEPNDAGDIMDDLLGQGNIGFGGH